MRRARHRPIAWSDPGNANNPVPLRSRVASFAERMRKNVLLIDDDAGVVRATRRSIATLYAVETATSAAAALEIIRAGARFDAILCDYHLGPTNAAEFVTALAAFDPKQAARVVIYSGVSPAERARLSSMGMAVLAKPSRREDLVQAIERVSAPG